MLSLAHKDISLAQDLANRIGVPFPIASTTRKAYSMAMIQDRGKQDWSAMLQFYRENSKK